MSQTVLERQAGGALGVQSAALGRNGPDGRRETWSCRAVSVKTLASHVQVLTAGLGRQVPGPPWMLAATKKWCVRGWGNFVGWNQFPKKAD